LDLRRHFPQALAGVLQSSGEGLDDPGAELALLRRDGGGLGAASRVQARAKTRSPACSGDAIRTAADEEPIFEVHGGLSVEDVTPSSRRAVAVILDRQLQVEARLRRLGPA
jgi:hypothetical protein